jgi:RNA polymerase sigma factor (sigma-70 family)
MRDRGLRWGEKVSSSELEGMLRGCFEKPDDPLTVSSFCGAFRPYLLALLSSLYPNDASIIEDALQAAFVKFLSLFRARSNHGQKNLGYFVVIARHCLIDEVRKKRGRIAFDDFADMEIRQGIGDFDEKVIWHIMVSAAMMQLDQRCRFVLESYYIQERDAKAIADELKVSHESFYVILQRSRASLRALLLSKARAYCKDEKTGVTAL